MPWKQNYTVSDERSLQDVKWPEGAACAVMLVIDAAPPCGPAGIGAAEWDSDAGRYARDVALPRLLDLLEQHGMHATFPVPAVFAEKEPALARRLRERGHEVAAHGWRREDVSGLQRHEETWRIARTTEILAQVLGERPAGWYSLPRQGDRFPGGAVTAHTMELLLEAGYSYFGNSQADDIPHYWVTDFDRRRALLALPYSYHFDDQFFIEFPAIGRGGNNLERPQALLRNWRAEFDAMAGTGGTRAFGRGLTCVVHGFLSGWGQRLEVLDQLLTHIRGGAAVWNPTGAQCAQYWRSTYPPETALKLAPSVWVDYPGSQG